MKELTFDVAIDKLFNYYNVSSNVELARAMNISQQTITNWKAKHSVQSIKKKCRELGVYEQIFGDANINIQKVDTISGGFNSQYNYGTQANNSIDLDLIDICNKIKVVIGGNLDKKESFLKHTKIWLIENI